MEILGIVLLVIGGVLGLVRHQQQQRSTHLKVAHTTPIRELKAIAATVAAEIGSGDWRDYVILWGTVQTDTPLTSALKQVPCVYYTSTIIREYEETIREKDRDDNWITHTQRGSETVSQHKQHTPFYLLDNTSEQVLVNPDGATIEAVEVLNEFRPGPPPSGSLSWGPLSLPLGVGSDTGQRHTLGYRYQESVIPVGQAVSVLAMASDRSGTITLEKPSRSSQPFLISPRSQETLTQAASRNAQLAFWAMVGCLGTGTAILLWAWLV